MAGCSLAYELARSARVCLLEAESRPGLHATSRSAALFAASYGGREIRAITRASRAFFDHPPPGFSDHPLLLGRALATLEQRLDPNRFFRANRRQIINLDFIDNVELGVNGRLHVQLREGPEVEISRRQARLFKMQMGI